MKAFTKNEKFTANGKTYKFSQDSKRNGGGTHVFAFDIDSRKVCQVAISDIDTPKTKVTYSDVKKALEAGFVSPLNSARTNYRVGEVFAIGRQEWEVTQADSMAPHKNVEQDLIENGKDGFWFFARKVLKSGRISKQTGMFYRFTKSGQYIKVW